MALQKLLEFRQNFLFGGQPIHVKPDGANQFEVVEIARRVVCRARTGVLGQLQQIAKEKVLTKFQELLERSQADSSVPESRTRNSRLMPERALAPPTTCANIVPSDLGD